MSNLYNPNETEDIKNFTISFFNSIKAEISNNGNMFVITNVPDNFEKFYGKPTPYRLVFTNENHDLEANENVELITPGSFLLHCMKEFLSERGKTSLVKIDFELDDKDAVKNKIKLRNCDISNIAKKPSYEHLLRFTFLTTLKYLNEKKEIMTSFYFKDGKQVLFNLDNYKTLEGKKEDISIGDIKPEYEKAKEQLKSEIQPKIAEISGLLGEKLEKEMERVKQHYENQLKEDKDNIFRAEKQIADLENQLKNNPNSSDKDFIQIKIKRSKENIDFLKSQKRKDELKREEEFFIKDEINKHSINLDNRMINTTIIYFPILKYSLYLKNNEGARFLELVYNPLAKTLSDFNCEVCAKPIKELWLCASGHISCYACSRACLDCGQEYCKNCVKTTCFSCEKPLCKKCAKKCYTCGKTKCKNHMHNSTTCKTCHDKISVKRPVFNFQR